MFIITKGKSFLIMVNAKLVIEKFNNVASNVDLTVAFEIEQRIDSPRIAIIFESNDNFRRLPMPVTVEDNRVVASGSYDLGYVFYGKAPSEIKISFVFSDGTDLGEKFDAGLVVNNVKKNRFRHFAKLSSRERIKGLIGVLLNALSLPYRLLPIKKNRVSFITGRTDMPTGNLRAVYNVVNDMEDVDVRLCCHGGGALSTFMSTFKFLHIYMTSQVVCIDDYYHLISYVKKRKNTKLIQLWHGCGAFKTFGFSRFHKESVLELYSPNHRQYDVAVVSSHDVVDLYAEAFGIDNKKVLPLGSPRCDALIDEDYKSSYSEDFYSEYPQLKNKKLLLFAPTFRGGGNGDCYYPTEMFDVDKILDALGDEWAMVIKLHPYLTEKFTCSERNKDRMVDCSNRDVNDVLIVSDFVVTDYSSVIFEASILNAPMAFYTYDLEEFIEKRDFYFDFKTFIPGPYTDNLDELVELIKQGGNPDAVETFKEKAFGNSIGTACDNIEKLIKSLIS